MPIQKSQMNTCSKLVVSSSPREYFGEVFFNSATGIGYPPETWVVVDLTKLSGGKVTRTAVSAFLSGIAVITNVSAGGGTEFKVSYANLTVAFREIGNTELSLECNYTIQAFTAIANEGIRSNVSIRIPLIDGKVEMKWNGSNYKEIGVPPFYALNLTVQDFCEP